MNLKIAFAACAAATLLAGCSPKLVAPEGYPQLYVSPDDSNVMLFTAPNLDLSGYRRIHLEPTQVRTAGAKDAAADPEAKELAGYVDEKLREALAPSFELVDEPGRGVLRIRFSIVGAEATSKAQMVMMVPPFAMVNMLSPKGAFTGSVTLGGEFFENESDKPSVAFVAYGSRPGIDASVAFRKWDAAKKVIDKATERLAKDLVALRE